MGDAKSWQDSKKNLENTLATAKQIFLQPLELAIYNKRWELARQLMQPSRGYLLFPCFSLIDDIISHQTLPAMNKPHVFSCSQAPNVYNLIRFYNWIVLACESVH